MSKLQPKFIAKAKACLKQARAPHVMSRSVLLNAARGSRETTYNLHRKLAADNEPNFWYFDKIDTRLDYPDYRIFSLKK